MSDPNIRILVKALIWLMADTNTNTSGGTRTGSPVSQVNYQSLGHGMMDRRKALLVVYQGSIQKTHHDARLFAFSRYNS